MTTEAVAEQMTMRDLMEWHAYERVYGPILVHERLDVGLAQIGLIMAKLWGKGNPKPRDFLPVWYRRPDDGSELGAMLAGLANGGDPSQPSAR